MLLRAKIGAIEFVGNEVRVAVVKTGGKTPTVLEVQSRTATWVEEEDRIPAMVLAVGEAVDALKHSPVSFVLCASGMHSIVRAITIPIRGRKRVLAAATFELEPHLAFPIDELLLDFNIVTEVDGETELLAVGVRRSHLDEHRAILEEAGIEVEAVNLDAVALTGLWKAGRKLPKGLKAVLHVREQCCSLVVLFNGNLAYFRNVPLSGDALIESPVRVAREVQNTLRAFLAKWRAGGEISELEVTGLDLSPGEQDALSTALRLPVSSGVMLGDLKGGAAVLAQEELPQGPNCWEGVVGAAFAGAGGGLALDFDGVGATQSGVARAVAPHLVYASGLALLALLLWGAYFYIGTDYYKGQVTLLQQDIDAISAEIEALEGQGLGPDVNADFFTDPPMLDILEDIGKRMPDSKVLLTRLSVSPPGAKSGWVTISGSTTEAANVGQVVDELSKSTLFRVDPNIRQEAEGNRVTFTVRVFRIVEEGDDGSE
ncbi:MAG: pilus assembly protein PilM [Candidatus Hydrogenedentes bacterium]|nr:pilus assembly protein PilM [Candidatus Hydrogenedentota bacterium]